MDPNIQPDIIAVKHYKTGFRLMKTGGDNKLYKFKNVIDMGFIEGDIFQVIHRAVVDNKLVTKSLTLDDPECGNKILEYWDKYKENLKS